ncbi:MAG: hypothetical protein F6K56_09470 [Moorea sp. SIO3G5]|nr:hypothetical protein [Moorena sp. SIO3G5]
MTKLGNILKKTMKLMSLLALIFSLYQLPAIAGNFSKTCHNIRLEDKIILKARCRRISGTYVDAAVSLNNCIDNRDGVLVFGGHKFSLTCRHISLLDDDYTLLAQCRRRNGRRHWSTLELDEGTTNNDGLLQCN